jgi:hypothetical protein
MPVLEFPRISLPEKAKGDGRGLSNNVCPGISEFAPEFDESCKPVTGAASNHFDFKLTAQEPGPEQQQRQRVDQYRDGAEYHGQGQY